MLVIGRLVNTAVTWFGSLTYIAGIPLSLAFVTRVFERHSGAGIISLTGVDKGCGTMYKGLVVRMRVSMATALMCIGLGHLTVDIHRSNIVH